MSIAVIQRVWDRSEASANDLLVLLALADNADEDRCLAWPSVDTIARKARVSRRTAQRCLRSLEEASEIELVRAGGRTTDGYKSAVYKVTPGRASEGRQNDTACEAVSDEAPRGDNPGHLGVTPVTQEPSVGTVLEPSGVSAARANDVDLVFTAWVTATGRSPSKTQLNDKRRRKIRQALKSHGLDDCIAAVTNIGRDPWASGQNDRSRAFNDIEHALGDAARIERWRDWQPPVAADRNGGTSGPRTGPVPNGEILAMLHTAKAERAAAGEHLRLVQRTA